MSGSAPQTSLTNKTITKLAAIKGSYVSMMTQLCRVYYDVPDTVKDNDASMKQLVHSEAKLAKLVAKHPSGLEQSLMSIQVGLGYLESAKTKEATQLHQSYVQEVAGYRSEAIDKIKLREQFVHTTIEYQREREKILKDVVQSMEKLGSVTGADRSKLRNQIDETQAQLQKKLEKLSKERNDIDKEEKHFHHKLTQLQTKIKKAAEAFGLKVPEKKLTPTQPTSTPTKNI